MESLDITYLNDLVLQAQQGSSNAFAELWAAVFQRQCGYSYLFLKDPDLVPAALQETCVRALKTIRALPRPEPFVPWLCRINFSVCREILLAWGEEEKLSLAGTDGSAVLPEQIDMLPVSESQALLMRGCLGLSDRGIADLMNISSGAAGRLVSKAQERFFKLTGRSVKTDEKENRDAVIPRLSSKKAAGVLDWTFAKCGRIPNSVPFEALSAYVIRRRERFQLKKCLEIAAIVLFLLVPLLLVPALTARDGGLHAKIAGMGDTRLWLTVVMPAIVIAAAAVFAAVRIALREKRTNRILKLRENGYRLEAERIGRMREDAARRLEWIRSRQDAAKWWRDSDKKRQEKGPR